LVCKRRGAKLLRSIIISPDVELAHELESAVCFNNEVTVTRTLDKYPTSLEMARVVRGQAPDILFLSFEAPDRAMEVVKYLEADTDGIQVIAVHSMVDAKVLRDTMRAGIREFLARPFEHDAVLDALRNSKELLDRKPAQHNVTSQVFAFMPSKAG